MRYSDQTNYLYYITIESPIYFAPVTSNDRR